MMARWMVFWWVGCVAISASSAMTPPKIVFPSKSADYTEIKQIYVIGSVAEGTTNVVMVNEVLADVSKTGAFIAMVPLVEGVNDVMAVCGGVTSAVHRVRVRKAPEPKRDANGEIIKPPPSKPRDPYNDLEIDRAEKFPDDPPYDKKKEDVLVVVDAGHGGSDSGALSPRGMKEKFFNLFQAKAIASALEKDGYRVMMTRTDDSAVALYERAKMAVRNKADLFISVHHNSTPADRDPREKRHFTVLYSNDKGRRLAEFVAAEVGPCVSGVLNQGARSQSLAVTRNPVVPSCLIEVDFINLPTGEEESLNPVRRQNVAAAVVRAVNRWRTRPEELRCDTLKE